ncbi:hypothetical protein [Pseudomonas sp. P1.8]|jgi:hypothetical protein|uniref:hypothetical protein n=1 Tax=Pseudomonas sp. P1.8 TaxID=1699310 RepID=UPI00069E164C|nr:hypothetical protein [Pseudomonas sp. P1.8]
MNLTRTALEQDIIDYIDDVQEIHEKALLYFNTMSEIRVLLLRMQDRTQELQERLIFQHMPETAAQKLYASSEETDGDKTNNKTSSPFKKAPSKIEEFGMKK